MMQSVYIILLALLTCRVIVKSHAQMCHSTEVFPLETDQYTFSCICNMLSTTCWWSLFTDRENTFNSGTSESQFMWQRSIGYGQYICVENNSTIVRDILILPQGEKSRIMSCIFLCVHVFEGRGLST